MGDNGLLKNTTEVIIKRKSFMGPAKVMINEDVFFTKIKIDKFNEKAKMPLINRTIEKFLSNLSKGKS